MVFQLLRSLERPGTIAKQSRAAHRKYFFAKKTECSLGDHLLWTESNGNIDQAALQIEHIGSGRDAHVNSGVPIGKAGQAGNQPQRGKAGSRGDGELARSRGGAKLVNGILQALKDLRSDPVERLPGIGQYQGAGSSLEQCQPQVIFERLDLPANGGLGKEQFLGSLSEAQIARSRFESLKERDLRQTIAFAWHS